MRFRSVRWGGWCIASGGSRPRTDIRLSGAAGSNIIPLTRAKKQAKTPTLQGEGGGTWIACRLLDSRSSQQQLESFQPAFGVDDQGIDYVAAFYGEELLIRLRSTRAPETLPGAALIVVDRWQIAEEMVHRRGIPPLLRRGASGIHRTRCRHPDIVPPQDRPGQASDALTRCRRASCASWNEPIASRTFVAFNRTSPSINFP